MTRPVAGLISCVSLKQKRPAPAIELYQSDLFKKSRKFVEKYHLPIYILSAKYGLIPSSKIIEPYDLTLNTMSKQEIAEWADRVAASVKDDFGSSPLLVLAGEKYLSFAARCENKIIAPLGKLSFGRRLQYLKKAIGEPS